MPARNRNSTRTDSSGRVVYSENVNWYTQPRPWLTPQPYVAERHETRGMDVTSSYNQPYVLCKSGSYDSQTYERAKAKFRGGLFAPSQGDPLKAQLGASIAEWKQSADMVTDRARQLRELAYIVKRRSWWDLLRFLRERGLTPPGSLKKRLNSRHVSAANLWLELHFGWVPLVGDVQDAISVLANGPSGGTVRGFASKTYDLNQNRPPSGLHYPTWVTVKHRLQATMTITSPNLYLANQLGLVNPLSIAWELVPFSFVVDWFYDVGDFLDSSSSLVGISLSNGFTTTTRESWGYVLYWSSPSAQTPSWSLYAKSKYVNRSIGIPSLTAKPPVVCNFPSLTRAATAWSLAVQAVSNLR